MQLFYHPDVKENDEQIFFPKDESRHIAKVLRKTEGDILNVTNGQGMFFSAEIITAESSQCVARIIDVTKEKPSPYHLTMAVAPTKMNDRYEWFLEKATEIGVQEITPVICEHSERKVVKLNRFERVLQSAMKQSLHLTLPKLNEPVTVSEFIKSEIKGEKFIAHCEDRESKQSLKSKIKPGHKITILIGPEGDFSSEEIELALKHSWQPVGLGNTRLRTETAAIVACHTVALANQE